MSITKIYKNGNSLVLKDTNDITLNIISSSSASISLSKSSEDVVYISDRTSDRVPSGEKIPIDWTTLEVPIVASRQDLMNVLESDYANSSIDVVQQDNPANDISIYLGQILSQLTIVTNTAKDDEIIDIETDGAVPAIGNYICLQENRKISQFEVTSVTPIAGNQYTLGVSIPIDHPYTTLGGCMLLNVDMNTDGSVTPIEFQIMPATGVKWDITRMIVSMVLSSQGDDGLFGNITKLSNGMFFRREDGVNTHNLFNTKDNSDFAIEGFDVSYPTRSGGGGSAGMRSRISFNGNDKRGVVVRLDGDNNEHFTATNRDDLTGLNQFRIKIQGHIVTD